MVKTQGYLLCVGGDGCYYRLANRMIRNIRKYDTVREICILTDDMDLANMYIEHKVRVVQFRITDHIHPNVPVDTDWSRWGFYPKVFQAYYSPFDETMFMDVDMIFHKDFTFMWDSLKESGISILGLSNSQNRSPSNWHWGNIENVMRCSGLNLPQIFSTLIIYNTRALRNMLSKHCSTILDNSYKWGLLRIFRGGLPDEIIYSLLLGLEGIFPNADNYHWIHNLDNCDGVNKEDDL